MQAATICRSRPSGHAAATTGQRMLVATHATSARVPLAGRKLTGTLLCLEADQRHVIPVSVSRTHHEASFFQYMDHLSHDFSVLTIPMGASLKRLGALEYEVQVPKLQVLDLWLQPLSRANVVAQQPGHLALQCDSAELHGSPQIKQMRLDQAFNLLVQVNLKWQPHGQLQPDTKAFIHVEASIDVDVVTPFPFSMMPTPALEMAGNTALKRTLQLMLHGFGGSLAADYQAWAASADIRARRAAAIDASSTRVR